MILGSLPRALGVCLILMSTPLFAAEQGGTSSTTNYWYGGELHPLVVERDGVNYRLIGKSVIEVLAGDQVTRTYAHADHLGSTRVITNDQGKVVHSLSYDGDYGLTRIEGESTAATDDSVASFYRFQGQEQEIFPLARLGIEDEALAQWLDRIELYHFPWRDYAAGLAAFAETDPVPTENSLYAALGANPVNFIDPSGGMMEESKYADDDDENEWTQLQDLLKRFSHNSEMRFTPKEYELLGKAYSKGDVFVKEIEQQSALRGELSKMLRNANHAINAAQDDEERKVLMDDVAHFQRWYDDAVARVRRADHKLFKFEEENAALGDAWRWAVLSLMLSEPENEAHEDKVVIDFLQSMDTSPSPVPPSTEDTVVTAQELLPRIRRSRSKRKRKNTRRSMMRKVMGPISLTAIRRSR